MNAGPNLAHDQRPNPIVGHDDLEMMSGRRLSDGLEWVNLQRLHGRQRIGSVENGISARCATSVVPTILVAPRFRLDARTEGTNGDDIIDFIYAEARLDEGRMMAIAG